MRGLPDGVATVAALLMLVGGCASEPSTESIPTTLATTSTVSAGPTPTTAAPTVARPYGGDFQVVNQWTPTSTINPFICLNCFSGGFVLAEIARNLHTAGAWRRDYRTGDAVPDLITEIPTAENGRLVLNDDGSMTVRFTVDPDAVWSDGEPITGDDFLFTFEVMADPDNWDRPFDTVTGFTVNANLTYGIRPENEGEPVIREGSARASGQDFEFVLDDPLSWYQYNLFHIVLPRHAVEGTDIFRDWNDRLWPSAGPFVFESWDPEAERLVFERNPAYWRTDPETGQRLPYLDRVVIDPQYDATLDRLPDDLRPAFAEAFAGYPVTIDAIVDAAADLGFDESVRQRVLEERTRAHVALMRDGVVHDFRFFIILPLVPEAGSEPGITYRTTRSFGWEHLAFNYADGRFAENQGSLVEHREFRQAIAHAIDRAEISRRVYGTLVEPLDSLVGTYSPAAGGRAWSQYDHDPARAEALLAELCDRLRRDCVADPPRLVFKAQLFRPDHLAVAEAVQEMLGEVGILVHIAEADFSHLFGCAAWEASTWNWTTGGVLPAFGAYRVFAPEDNAYHWGTTEPITDAVDDPTTDCDDTNRNTGPSAMVDEFTERYDTVLAGMQASPDPTSLLLAVQELEEILADNAVIIPLYVRPNFELYRSDLIGGYGYEYWSFSPSSEFWNADRWWRKDLEG